MRFEHLVVNPYDQNLDYKKISDELFHGRYLAVLEQQKGKLVAPHVHIQGETEHAPTTFEDKVSELITKNHYKRKLPDFAKCRPCKKAKTHITAKGFQYMMKADDTTPLASRGFEDADLKHLHEQSEEHVDDLKTKIPDRIFKLCPSIEKSLKGKSLFMQEFYIKVKICYLEESSKEDRNLPQSNQLKSVCWTIMRRYFTSTHRLYADFQRAFARLY